MACNVNTQEGQHPGQKATLPESSNDFRNTKSRWLCNTHSDITNKIQRNGEESLPLGVENGSQEIRNTQYD